MNARRYTILAASILLAVSAHAQWQPPSQVSGPIYYNGGFVGIGTTTPTTKLYVKVISGGDQSIIVENSGAPGFLTFAGGNSDTIPYFAITNIADPATALAGFGWFYRGTDGNLQLQRKAGSTTWTNVLLVDRATGYVGIGTTTPTKALDVNGDINVSGNINAKYQDVAEWVPADGQIASGTVVVLDTEHANRVIPSSIPYDTSIAGVVSAHPGISLGEPSASKVLVATSGRVRTKVDATRHPIRIGDLLVTSGKPGIAMRSEPLELAGRRIHQPGTLVGKALEPLDGGVGEILVLLSLQ